MTLTCRSVAVSIAWLPLVAALTAGCDVTLANDQFTVREEKRFTVTGAPQINLTTFDGSIEICGWDRQEVVVEIEKRGPDKAATDLIRVEATQAGNTITVTIPKPERRIEVRTFGWNNSAGARIIASVPRSSNLLARSGDGSVSVERLSGRVDVKTEDGSVHLDEVAGDLLVRTGDGSVRARDVDGKADIETGDGSVTLEGTLRVVRLTTNDGSAHLTARTGSAMDADWSVSTGDGGVRVELPSGFNADLDAHTGGGRVHVDRADITLTGTDDKTTVKARLGAGGKALRIRTGDGSITVGR